MSAPGRGCDTNACIEVEAANGVVVVRSTETLERMAATREEWDAFVERVKAGDFDAV